MDAKDILRTYAVFFVSENDDYDTKKKLELLNVIENAEDESALETMFKENEFELPDFMMEEKDDVTLIGESVILLGEADDLLEKETLLEVDIKNKLKDLLGMQTDLKYKISKATGQAKDALEKQLANVQDKISDLRAAAGKVAEKGVKAGKEALEKGKEMAGEAGEKVSKAAGKAVETAKDVAGEAGEKVAGAASKAAEFAKDQPGMVGATAAAAAALTAGVMAYRRFFSKAAKACAGAPDRKACLAQYKLKAKQAQISALNAGKAKCAKSKKPDACKAKIDAKISALKAKAAGSSPR